MRFVGNVPEAFLCLCSSVGQSAFENPILVTDRTICSYPGSVYLSSGRGNMEYRRQRYGIGKLCTG